MSKRIKHASFRELSAYQDDPTAIDADLIRHIRQCVKCRATVDELTRMDEAIQALPVASLPEDL